MMIILIVSTLSINILVLFVRKTWLMIKTAAMTETKVRATIPTDTSVRR